MVSVLVCIWFTQGVASVCNLRVYTTKKEVWSVNIFLHTNKKVICMVIKMFLWVFRSKTISNIIFIVALVS